MGAALTVCTLPGQKPSDRLGPGEVEMGLGIHGEPGHSKESLGTAREVIRSLVHRRVERLPPGCATVGRLCIHVDGHDGRRAGWCTAASCRGSFPRGRVSASW